jgi:hypothetical protein
MTNKSKFHVRALRTIIDGEDIDAENENEAELIYLQTHVGVQSILAITKIQDSPIDVAQERLKDNE